MTWTPRTVWSQTRLGGAYLKTSAGDYVTDVLGRRIVVIVPGGSLTLTEWTPRTVPS